MNEFDRDFEADISELEKHVPAHKLSPIVSEVNKRQFVLCYVENNFTYFTSRELSKQWGDDWNDAPYEHNAGTPYEPHDNDVEKWEIVKIAINGIDTEMPGEGYLNSRFSVETINNGAAPWLLFRKWNSKKQKNTCKGVPAGTTLENFLELVKEFDGEVFVGSSNKYINQILERMV